MTVIDTVGYLSNNSSFCLIRTMILFNHSHSPPPWKSPNQLRLCVCVYVYVCFLSRVLLFFNPMDCSPPGSSAMAFPKEESWSVLPFPSPGDLLDPGIEPTSSAWQADSLPLSYKGGPILVPGWASDLSWPSQTGEKGWYSPFFFW